MSGLRVHVDRSRCAVTGMCEARAPEVFVIDYDGGMRVLQESVDPARHEAVREAVRGCPTRALRLEED